MKNIEIISLSPDMWPEYKSFRLSAIKEEPTAWSQTYEEVNNLPDSYWKEQLEKAQENLGHWLYFAKVNNEIVGMVMAIRETREIVKHIAMLHSVSVKKNYRGKGLASELMKKILNKLKEQDGLLKIHLGVISSQTPAISLYKKFGFEIVGRRKMVFKFEDNYLDEILMDLMLS
jgi:ribosomal protein S18 acetylase RimI-like enzyme